MKSTKELRKKLREALKIPNLRAIRMVLYSEDDNGCQMIEDIIESGHIVIRGFKYNGFLESMCVQWHNRIVDIEVVPKKD